jgi:hypothetical protein
METYIGHVPAPADANILFEACRIGLLPRVQRRLSEKERRSIRCGSVFVWDEREAGMRRWTDGKSWGPSRVSGGFLTYRELAGKRRGGYKLDGLMKQSFSITTSTGQRLHLISYFLSTHPAAATLQQPCRPCITICAPPGRTISRINHQRPAESYGGHPQSLSGRYLLLPSDECYTLWSHTAAIIHSALCMSPNTARDSAHHHSAKQLLLVCCIRT